MSFQNYLCWQPDEVFSIIKPDAESLEDQVFLSVHTDTQINVKSGDLNDRGRYIKTSEFIKDFLEEKHDHFQVSVIGQSGTGKSHFIQWIRTHLPKTEDVNVLTIHKAGTSLRNIIRQIINLLPENEQSKYLEEWGKISHTVTSKKEQRIKLLNNIASAIEVEKVDNFDSDDEELLHSLLPSIFYDPYYRNRYFLVDDSIINELADHIFSENGKYDPNENRRLFNAKDIPVSGGDFLKSAQDTQQLISELHQSGETLNLAIEIINRNLDRAITDTLSFSSDAMIELMNDLRRSLYSKGQSLVLLIEDFARLQGVDTALLQALITPSSQGEDTLCKLKWVMAVTTGYFNKLEETVRTRMDYIIEMGAPWEGIGKAKDKTLLKFTAKYMNAVRLGYENVEDWYKTRSLEDEKIISRCDKCAYKSECHSGFGSIDGYGIYPFNEKVLSRMDRISREGQGEFNPRAYLKKVLIPILNKHAESLSMGAFPPKNLISESNFLIPPVERQSLKNIDPSDYKRRLVFCELWGGGKVGNLDEVVHNAFSLPPLRKLGSADLTSGIDASEGDGLVEKGHENTPTSIIPPDVQAIREWVTGKPISERLVNRLRGIVYEMISTHISWDTIGLSKSFFSSPVTAKPFRQRSINFKNQRTQATKSQVQITLPLRDKEESLLETAIALEGILQYQHYGNWRFDNADKCFVTLLNCLNKWSAEVVKQITSLTFHKDIKNFNDPMSVMLLLGGILSGNAEHDKLPSLINSSLSDWPEHEFLSKTLTSIYESLREIQPLLLDYYRSTSSGSKGGQVGAYLNPMGLMNNVSYKKVETWLLEKEIPSTDEIPEMYKRPMKVLKKIQENYFASLDDEYAKRKELQQVISKSIGENVSSFLNSARDLHALVHANGFDCHGQEDMLINALNKVSQEDIEKLVKNLKAVKEKNNLPKNIYLYSQCHAEFIGKIRGLEQVLNDCISNVEKNVGLMEDESIRGDSDINHIVTEIHTSLDELVSSLGDLN